MAVALGVGAARAEDPIILPPDLPAAALSADLLAPEVLAPALEAPVYESYAIGVRAAEPEAAPAEPQTTASVPGTDQPNALASVVAPTISAILPPDLPQPDLTFASEHSAFIAERAPLVGTIAPRLPEAERKALTAFYAERAWQPVWIGKDGFTEAARLIAARLADAPSDGLFARDYPLPPLDKASPSAMAEAEVQLSALAILYARDARGGRLEPRRLSNLITPKLQLPGASEVLQALAVSPDPGATLRAYNPRHPGYLALRAKLSELRGDRTPSEPMVHIPEGPPLKLGMRDARVPLIRARLKLGPGEEPVYDRDLADAVSAFQKSAGLPATGVTNRPTLDALRNAPTARLEGDLVAQMERWRWAPVALGERHIIVNVPEFKVRIVDQGEIEHEARVIVGKPETPTPIFSHVMDQVVLNPSWFVPPSILRKEFLPRLASDPSYAARRGYVVTRGRNGAVSVRQPPGAGNALGHIKFLFPNEHAVYLHDTPGRHLFASERRAFSHGCVRVDQPMKLGEKLMGRDEGWSEQKLRSLVGHGERSIKLTRPLPIHITYQTHVVDAEGKLATFQDLYGFHRLVRVALGFGA